MSRFLPAPIFRAVPASRRGGREVCVYCNRTMEPRRGLCPHCGKTPFMRESRVGLLGLSGAFFVSSLALQPWAGLLFALSVLFLSGGLFLMARQEHRMSEQRLVFLPLAFLMFAMIPWLAGSAVPLVLALLGTAFTYCALPSLHSPASEDLSRSIEEFEAHNQLTYGFGNIRDQIRATISASDGAKQMVLTRELMPRINHLLDKKLLSILKRKVSLERIMATTDPNRLEDDRKRALDRAALVKSDAVRGELARSAALSKSMQDNYQKIAELLNVYNVQIRNLQKVLLNLNMKIAASAFNDGGLDSIREPLDALDQEMEVLERSFKDFDLMLQM
ncbi:MAG: hypothetical protein HY814_03190 [Candidatus Riflebacteria bacterium]|nr:hypothetical protein [Candidatus Riflebacteria bacterium]